MLINEKIISYISISLLIGCLSSCCATQAEIEQACSLHLTHKPPNCFVQRPAGLFHPAEFYTCDKLGHFHNQQSALVKAKVVKRNSKISKCYKKPAAKSIHSIQRQGEKNEV